MATSILTTEEFENFKIEFLKELREIKNTVKNKRVYPEWLKSKDLMSLFGLSPTTLHRLRTSGKLPYTKIQGTIYYSTDDLMNLLEENKNE